MANQENAGSDHERLEKYSSVILRLKVYRSQRRHTDFLLATGIVTAQEGYEEAKKTVIDVEAAIVSVISIKSGVPVDRIMGYLNA